MTSHWQNEARFLKKYHMNIYFQCQIECSDPVSVFCSDKLRQGFYSSYYCTGLTQKFPPLSTDILQLKF